MRALRLGRTSYGFMLIEAAVYILVLGMIMAAFSATFYLLLNGSFTLTHHAASLEAVERFRLALRDDIDRCEGLAAEISTLKAGERVLLLKMKDGTIRAWAPSVEGGGVARSDFTDGQRSEEVNVLRDAKVVFSVQERTERAIVVVVEISLPTFFRETSLRAPPFVSFSVFKETR
jgi:hypothetical protein